MQTIDYLLIFLTVQTIALTLVVVYLAINHKKPTARTPRIRKAKPIVE